MKTSIRNYFLKRKLNEEADSVSKNDPLGASRTICENDSSKEKKETVMTRTTSSSLDSDTTVVEISQADNETISTKCDIVISETQIPLCSKTTESSTIGTQSILENLSKTNPVRPIKNSYPQRLLGGQLRSFQASWYEKREWNLVQ